ncbi:MAG TPA: response regulator, partial [Vicinamibacterales bacterium]
MRILHLEDDPADAALVEALLRGEGFDCRVTRAASRQEFVAGLEAGPDIILADYSLPGFDGIVAQRLARELRPDVPFVFVSGTMGEEVAIDRLKDGATDYVLKHRLQRLGAALRRALAEAEER